MDSSYLWKTMVDSDEEDVVFSGPVSEREYTLSQQFDDTIALESDSSVNASVMSGIGQLDCSLEEPSSLLPQASSTLLPQASSSLPPQTSSLLPQASSTVLSAGERCEAPHEQRWSTLMTEVSQPTELYASAMSDSTTSTDGDFLDAVRCELERTRAAGTTSCSQEAAEEVTPVRHQRRGGEPLPQVQVTTATPRDISILDVSLQPFHPQPDELAAATADLTGSHELTADDVTAADNSLDCTDDMMERLLEMEAEERYLEEVLRCRGAGLPPPDSPRPRAVHQTASVRPADVQAVNAPARGALTAIVPAVSTTAVPAAGSTRRAPAASSRLVTPGRLGAVSAPTRTQTQLQQGQPTPRRTPAAARHDRAVPPPPTRATPTPRSKSANSRTRTPSSSTDGSSTSGLSARGYLPSSATKPRRPNVQSVASPVARYISQTPAPCLVQLARTRPAGIPVSVLRRPVRPLGVAIPPPTALNAPHRLLQTDDKSIVTSYGRENQPPKSRLPCVNYVSSGKTVVIQNDWNRLVRSQQQAKTPLMKQTRAAPTPVTVIKHHGHRQVASRRVGWNDALALQSVKVAPLRRSLSESQIDADTTMANVSVVNIRSGLHRQGPLF